MVISQMVGGLGNQFFEYAFGKAIAERLGEPFALDVTHYAGPQRTTEFSQFIRAFSLGSFKISAPIATDDEIYQVRDKRRSYRLNRYARSLIRRISPRLLASMHFGFYREQDDFKFDPYWSHLRGNVYLMGCWQNPRYFEQIATTLRAEFQPRDPGYTARAQQAMTKLRERTDPGQPLIALHVRRGDLAHASEVLKSKNLFGPPVSLHYVESAASRFDPQSSFAVFSDDPQWCKDNIKLPHLQFVEGQSDLEDFALMRLCDHFIISNSTFSWWAAWLCDNPHKRVVAPRQWAYQEVYPHFDVRSIIPTPWEVI